MDNSDTQDHDRPYREVLGKPLEEIREDIFFRADSFEGEAWYDDLMMYLRIGVCQPEPGHIPELQKALKIMGRPVRVMENGGKPYLVPGECRTQEKSSQGIASRR